MNQISPYQGMEKSNHLKPMIKSKSKTEKKARRKLRNYTIYIKEQILIWLMAAFSQESMEDRESSINLFKNKKKIQEWKWNDIFR